MTTSEESFPSAEFIGLAVALVEKLDTLLDFAALGSIPTHVLEVADVDVDAARRACRRLLTLGYRIGGVQSLPVLDAR